MKILNIPQRSPEWYRWRMEGITASDISLIRNPNSKGYADLLREKMGIPDPEIKEEKPIEEKRANFERFLEVQKSGDFGERILNQIFFDKTGYRLRPICAEHEKFNQWKCSIDGFCPEHGIFEWKFSKNIKKFERFKNGSKSARSINPYLEQDQLLQIQFIMMVTGWNEITMGYLYEAEDGKLEAFFRVFKKDPKLCKEIERNVRIFLSYLNNMNIPLVGRVEKIANLTVIPGEKNA
jgi:YqaJ-like viral recombinase domain